MRIILAPDSFKESLSAREVCEAIARGIRRVRPDAIIDSIPMADGGEGTVDALVSATGGALRQTTVTGPLGEPVTATWGLLGDGSNTAVIEMAAASGLALVPSDRRNPLLTTTYGTGELIRAAIESGATRLIVGIGGSATTDGGAGAAQACGYRFLDATGRPIPAPIAGGQLDKVAQIDRRAGILPAFGGAGILPAAHQRDAGVSHRRAGVLPALRSEEEGGAGGSQAESTAPVSILVACDVDNPLYGPRGAAAIYGPQKGATPEQVQILDRNLAHLADLIERDLGKNVRDFPGTGAAGGLGAGMVAFFNARLDRGIRLVMEAVHFEQRIKDADLIITGEGRLDRQSMMGKVIAGVGQAGKDAGVPVVALVGCTGEGAEAALEVLRSFHPINPPEMPLQEALARTPEALESTAAAVLASFSES
jgi:glycerate kinase